MAGGAAVVVMITTTSDNLERFCQRLAVAVENSQVYLASVIATGTQIYPVRVDAIGTRPQVLECEFRPRHRRAVLTSEVARDLANRLAPFEVSEVAMVDERGKPIVAGSSLRVAV